MAKNFTNWLLVAGVSLLGWGAIAIEGVRAATLTLGEPAEANLDIDLGFYPLRDGLNLISPDGTSQSAACQGGVGFELSSQMSGYLSNRYYGIMEVGSLDWCSQTTSPLGLNGSVETNYKGLVEQTIDDAENTPITRKNSPLGYLAWAIVPLSLGGIGALVLWFARSKSDKPEVPDDAMLLYRQALQDVQFLGQMATSIDSNKFSSEEFLLFVKVKHMLNKGLEDYEGLYDSLTMLEVAIRAKDSFLKIDQAELRYRGFKQQQFYEFVEERLVAEVPKQAFRDQVQSQLTTLLPHVKTDEGKIALQSYAHELDRLAEHELGLKLLALFKKYQLGDYTILRTIADMANNQAGKDLKDFSKLVATVTVHYDVFEKLGQIIGLPKKQSNPETYAKMVQFLGLNHRHQDAYKQFEELIAVLRKWYKPYQAIARIRQAYPADDYQQPQEFNEEIPGLNIYRKYKNWLTDKRTGYSYVDFGDMG